MDAGLFAFLINRNVQLFTIGYQNNLCVGSETHELLDFVLDCRIFNREVVFME